MIFCLCIQCGAWTNDADARAAGQIIDIYIVIYLCLFMLFESYACSGAQKKYTVTSLHNGLYIMHRPDRQKFKRRSGNKRYFHSFTSPLE